MTIANTASSSRTRRREAGGAGECCGPAARVNFEDVVKIQTEFMSRQLNSFNPQAKSIGELYTTAAADAMKTPFSVSR
jgi:hypothetical protein